MVSEPMNFWGFIFPLSFFVLTLAVYWTGAFFLIYHLVRFGIGTEPKKTAYIFLIGSLVLTIFVIISFTLIDYKAFLTELSGFRL